MSRSTYQHPVTHNHDNASHIPPEHRWVRLGDIVPNMIPVARSTALEWEKQGRFPQSVRIGSCRMYRYSDVLQFMETLAEQAEKGKNAGDGDR